MGYVKNSLLCLGMLAIFSLTSYSANASLLIEPHLGYNVTGDADYETNETKYNGPQYGARLGVQSLGFMGGLDYTHSSFTYKTTGAADSKQKRDQLGLFVGYNFPVLVRAWVGYYFSDKTKDDDGSSTEGHGTEVGLGFTGLPFLSINLQYRMSTHDTGTSRSGAEAAINPEFETSEIVLGVSLPLNI